MRALRLLPFAFLAVACARAPVAPEARPAGVAAGPRTVVADDGLGYSFELPAKLFRSAPPGEAVVAVGSDGTLVRVWPEFFAHAADDRACWERLVERARDIEGLEGVPAAPGELSAKARAGLSRGDRSLYFAPFPRGTVCLVVLLQGPKDSPALAEAASTAFATFRPLEPSREMRGRTAFEAGARLLEGGERDAKAALASFEAALAADPSLTRAHLGAGLAAFFSGDEHARTAIGHLEKLLAERGGDEASEEERLEGAPLKDALMYLGLAYAQVKEYGLASARLAETVARFPDDAVALYNFACVLALSGEGDEALHNLRAALALDPELRDHARTDKDLESLRPRPEWGELVGAATGGDATGGR